MNKKIICPSCHTSKFNANTCNSCGFLVADVDGKIDLRTDKSYDTLLDVGSYDEYHSIAGDADPGVFDLYRNFLEDSGLKPSGSALEIACGSGKLTASILAANVFDELHCGDISAAFMAVMDKRIEGVETSTKVQKYLFDANHLPFKDKSFQYVFGNSVLHHFAEFEATIADSFRVLKPGGAAVFGEPLFDSHALVSLAAGLIARNPDALSVEGMTKKHIAALNVIKDRLTVKLDNLHGDRTNLKDVEDKFIFPSEMLRDLGRDLGYSSVAISKVGPTFNIGAAARVRIERIIARVGLSVEPIQHFKYVFEALSRDYGDPMRAYMHPVFAHVAFIK